jgi:hypothetical protein
MPRRLAVDERMDATGRYDDGALGELLMTVAGTSLLAAAAIAAALLTI